MPIEDFIITVFCLIDDECKKIGGGHRLTRCSTFPILN